MSLVISADSSNFDGKGPEQSVHMTWDDDAADEFFEAEESYYQDAPELPDGTFYEETIDDAENIYDTEEFDEVYSTYYVDAKQRFNQLRQSRGFYPVVAVVDGKVKPH